MSGSHSSRRSRHRHSRRSSKSEPAVEFEDQAEAPASERQRRHRRKSRSAEAGHDTSHSTDGPDEFNGTRAWMAIRVAVILALGVGGYFLFRQVFATNATPSTISLMAPVVPAVFGVYLVMTLNFRPYAFFTGLFFIIGSFIFIVHLRQRDFDDFSFDWAVMAQFAVAGAGGLWALFNVRKLVTSWPWLDSIGILMMVFIGLSALSLSIAPNPAYGAASLGTFSAFLAVAAMLCMQLRSGEIQALLALATLAPLVLSLISYHAQPEMNFTWGMSTDYSVPRLRGVVGTPVGMSNQCFLLVLACFARVLTAKRNRIAWISFSILALPLAGWVTWLSESRAPPAAFVITAIIVSVLYFKPFGRHSLLISIVGGLAALPLAYFLIDQGVTDSVLAGMSRTGQATEISTLTGRLEMWKVAFAKIAERPFLGYGFGSGAALVADLFEGTDLHIVHFHNLAIHTAYSIGVAGSVLLTLLIVLVFARAYAQADLFAMLLMLYLVMTNITETSILANKPSYYTFMFLLAICRVLGLNRQPKKREGAESRSSQSYGESRSEGRRRTASV